MTKLYYTYKFSDALSISAFDNVLFVFKKVSYSGSMPSNGSGLPKNDHLWFSLPRFSVLLLYLKSTCLQHILCKVTSCNEIDFENFSIFLCKNCFLIESQETNKHSMILSVQLMFCSSPLFSLVMFLGKD